MADDIFDKLAAGHDESVTEKVGNATYYHNLMQRSEAWFEARRGLITASEMSLILTPATLKVASNDKVRQHVYELLAQRITGYVEPSFQGYDMVRGNIEEIEARKLYTEHVAPVKTCGFVTNDKWGFKIGYSPDGLVGDDGLIEIKSRIQKYQFQLMCEHVEKAADIPRDFILQVQTGLMVTERKWCDFLSYSNGLPMVGIRVFADPEMHEKIEEAAKGFEAQILEKTKAYTAAMKSKKAVMIATERQDYGEII